MTLLPTTDGRARLEALEAHIGDVARQVVVDGRDEKDARLEVVGAVFDARLAKEVIDYWVYVGRRHWARYLEDDLIHQAEGWLYRAVTGERTEEWMRKGQGASLLSFEKVHSGTSAVGYLRKSLVGEISKFLRTIDRRTHLLGGDFTFDPVVVGGDYFHEDEDDEHCQLAAAVILNKRAHVASEPHDDAAHMVEVYETSRGRDAVRKVLAQANVIRSFYAIPSPRRPVDPALRTTLLEQVGASHETALEAMKSYRGDGNTSALGLIWRGYSPEDFFGVLSSARPADVAHALALAALCDLPRPPRDKVRKFRIDVSKSFHEAGLEHELGQEFSASFLDSEFGSGGDGSWVDHARILRSSHPSLLGGSVREIRMNLFRILDTSEAWTASI